MAFSAFDRIFCKHWLVPRLHSFLRRNDHDTVLSGLDNYDVLCVGLPLQDLLKTSTGSKFCGMIVDEDRWVNSPYVARSTLQLVSRHNSKCVLTWKALNSWGLRYLRNPLLLFKSAHSVRSSLVFPSNETRQVGPRTGPFGLSHHTCWFYSCMLEVFKLICKLEGFFLILTISLAK